MLLLIFLKCHVALWHNQTMVQPGHFCWRISPQMLAFWLKQKFKGKCFFITIPPYPPWCSLLQPLSWPQRRNQGLSSVLPTSPSSTASPLTVQNQCTAEHYPVPFVGKTIRFWLVGYSPPQNFSFGPTLQNNDLKQVSRSENAPALPPHHSQ